MRAHLCGVRGSSPAVGAAFAGVGGNTSCIALRHETDTETGTDRDGGADADAAPRLLLDAGTGIRLVTSLLGGDPFRGTILLGHLHWDHTQGLPFFEAANRPDARTCVLVPEQGLPAVELFERFMSPPAFPVGPRELSGNWSFGSIDEGPQRIEGFDLVAREIPHKGGRAFGYRISDGRGSLAYLSDHGPLALGPGPDGLGPYHEAAVALCNGVDVLIHDAQHTASELPRRAHLGHSAAEYTVGLARHCGVGRVVLFHHDPDRTDRQVANLERTLRQGDGPIVEAAREGVELRIAPPPVRPPARAARPPPAGPCGPGSDRPPPGSEGPGMAATSWLIRRRLCRRWPAMLPLALIVAAGATGALVALGAAERTSTAYTRYVERAEVGDLQINPSLSSAEIDGVIRSLPGVRAAVGSSVLFNAGIDEGQPRTGAELNGRDNSANLVQVRGSVDGRYATMDRPALTAGRLPTGPREAIVGVGMAEKHHLRIGDVVPLSFWSALDMLAVEDGNADPATVLSPAGVEHVTVVGIATLPDEVLPDGLYRRVRMIVSPDVAARYTCSPQSLPRDGSYEEITAAMFPHRCAISYRYYSLAVEGGDRGVAEAQDAFVREGAELNAHVPPALAERGVGYVLIPTTTAYERDRVERSTRPTVTALVVLGMAAAGVTALIAGLAVARELRRTAEEQVQWWRLGLTTLDRTRVVVVPLLLAVATGLGAALGLAWWLSPVGPVGNVRSIEPSPDRHLSPWAWLGALALAAVLAVGVVVVAAWASRRAGRRSTPRLGVPAVRRLIAGSARPEVGEGIRAAFDGRRGAGLVVATGAIALAAFLAAVVFGASLSTLVSSPRAYGWPWDLAVMSGYGYGGLDLDAIDTTMVDRPDVEHWTALAFTNSVSVDGEPVVSMIGLGRDSDLHFAVAQGRLPAAEDEVALGRRTAATHGAGVGDEVRLDGDNFEARRATVTGLVVLPALGPFESDRASPGDGMLLPATMLDPAYASQLATFVGVDLVDGAEQEAALTTLRQDYPAWRTDPFTVEYSTPVRPAEIVNARGMRAVPLLVGGLLGVTVVVGLSLAVFVSVRARRREFGILRALGFTGRQLRDSVRVQAVATILTALAVGVPVGLIIGRSAWRAFASGLAVVQPPSIPAGWILATVIGAVVVALAAASVPARIASRARAADVLRSE